MASPAHECFTEEYRNFVRFFEHVNSLVIAAEREVSDQTLNMSAVVELRSAFTHLMRVQSVEAGITPTAEIEAETGFAADEYCKQNLNKAVGHLYRAGYDAYDGLTVSLDIEIEDLIQSVSQTTLYHVITDAAEEVFKKRERARAAIGEAKASKDIASLDAEQQTYRVLEEASALLTDVRDVLREHMDQLVSYEASQRRDTRRNWVYGGTVGAVFSYIVYKLVEWGLAR